MRDVNTPLCCDNRYLDAAWMVAADVACIGDLMKLGVVTDFLEDDATQRAFAEFSQQYLAELDYRQELRNLEAVYATTFLAYKEHICVPRAYPDLCSGKVITMEYLPGPKLEDEAKRQLAALGIDFERGVKETVTNPEAIRMDEVCGGSG